jgi:hypothetical protein
MLRATRERAGEGEEEQPCDSEAPRPFPAIPGKTWTHPNRCCRPQRLLGTRRVQTRHGGDMKLEPDLVLIQFSVPRAGAPTFEISQLKGAAGVSNRSAVRAAQSSLRSSFGTSSRDCAVDARRHNGAGWEKELGIGSATVFSRAALAAAPFLRALAPLRNKDACYRVKFCFLSQPTRPACPSPPLPSLRATP